MIYLASPYSSPIAGAPQLRYEKVCGFVNHCLAQGIPVFSPIAYAHPLATRFGLRGDAQYWLEFNTDMLRHSEALFVYMLSGWDKSKGVQLEIRQAKGILIPQLYWNEDFTPNLEMNAK